MNTHSEKDIIGSILKGNTSDYRMIVDHYQNKAYSLAFSIVKSEEDAEEIAQDSFVKAFKSLETFNQQSTFGTWLYRIVYNTALSFLRKKRVTKLPIDEVHQIRDLSGSADSFKQLVKADQREILEQAIQQLKPEESVLIELYYVQEKDMKEIGDVIGLSHSNVRIKLMRIRKKLMEQIQSMLKSEVEDLWI